MEQPGTIDAPVAATAAIPAGPVLRRYVSLIRREFWEHRSTFVVVPVALAAFITALLLAAFLLVDVLGIDATISVDRDDSSLRYRSDEVTVAQLATITIERLSHLPVDRRPRVIHQFLHGVGVLFQGVLWLVMAFYLLDTLYQDRRDRSILFWKSMPVSDISTVLAKLVTGTIAVPLIYLGCTAAVHLVILVFGSLSVIGDGLPLWDALWSPAGLVGFWGGYVVLLFAQFCWGLPVYGGLLAVSAAARSVPLVWAVAVPFAIAAIEGIVTQRARLVPWLADHGTPLYVMQMQKQYDGLAAIMTSTSALSGVVVGVLLVALAIWLRHRAGEI